MGHPSSRYLQESRGCLGLGCSSRASSPRESPRRHHRCQQHCNWSFSGTNHSWTTIPLEFLQSQIPQAERNYSTFDRELLAGHQAIRHFLHFLESVTFTIQTDHTPLVHAFTRQTDAWSPRQRRHLSTISEFNFTFKHLPGKENPLVYELSRSNLPHIATTSNGNNAFFLKDPVSGVLFLMDTGTSFSLLPASRWKKPQQPTVDVKLASTNGIPIPAFGRQHLNVKIGSCTNEWSVIVADVTISLLGADILALYQILVDVARCQLVDAASLNSTPITAAPSSLTLQVTNTDDFAHLRSTYPDVIKPELRQQPQNPAKHGIYHRKTSSPPLFS